MGEPGNKTILRIGLYSSQGLSLYEATYSLGLKKAQSALAGMDVHAHPQTAVQLG